jgi:hypothetical protein
MTGAGAVRRLFPNKIPPFHIPIASGPCETVGNSVIFRLANHFHDLGTTEKSGFLKD